MIIKNYAKKLINDVLIRNFIKKNYSHCGVGSVVIERPSDRLNLIIKTSKPGVLIGKKVLILKKINQSVEIVWL